MSRKDELLNAIEPPGSSDGECDPSVVVDSVNTILDQQLKNHCSSLTSQEITDMIEFIYDQFADKEVRVAKMTTFITMLTNEMTTTIPQFHLLMSKVLKTLSDPAMRRQVFSLVLNLPVSNNPEKPAHQNETEPQKPALPTDRPNNVPQQKLTLPGKSPMISTQNRFSAIFNMESDEKENDLFTNSERTLDFSTPQLRNPKTPTCDQRNAILQAIEGNGPTQTPSTADQMTPNTKIAASVKPPQVKIPTWNPDNPTCTIQDHFESLMDHIPACRPADELALTMETLEGDAYAIYRSAATQARRKTANMEEILIYARTKTEQVFGVKHLYGSDSELRSLTQGSLTLRQYYIRLHKLFLEASANGNTYTDEWLARHFCTNLADKQLAHALLLQRPSDIFTAYQLASEATGKQAHETVQLLDDSTTKDDVILLAQDIFPEIDDNGIETICTLWHKNRRLPFDAVTRLASIKNRGACWACKQHGHYSHSCPTIRTSAMQHHQLGKNPGNGTNSPRPWHRRWNKPQGQQPNQLNQPNQGALTGTHKHQIHMLEDLFDAEGLWDTDMVSEIENMLTMRAQEIEQQSNPVTQPAGGTNPNPMHMMLASTPRNEQEETMYAINASGRTFYGHRSRTPLSLQTTVHCRGTKFRALFDTGASVCAVSKELADRLQLGFLQTEKLLVTGVDGISNSLGRVFLHVTFTQTDGTPTEPYLVSAIVLKNLSTTDIILSDEFLRDANAITVFNKADGARLILNGKEIAVNAKFLKQPTLNIVTDN